MADCAGHSLPHPVDSGCQQPSPERVINMATRASNKGRSARSTSTTAPAAPAQSTPAFSFSNLSVEDTDAMDTSTGRGLDLSATPFPAAIEASWNGRKAGGRRGREYGAPKSVTVPQDKVNSTVRLIRAAAGAADLGVRIVQGKPDNGKVSVAFRAQTKRNDK